MKKYYKVYGVDAVYDEDGVGNPTHRYEKQEENPDAWGVYAIAEGKKEEQWIAVFSEEQNAREYAMFQAEAGEYFPITRTCRGDLEGIGYDTEDVDDCTMEQLASKLSNAYTDQVYWIDLPIIADDLDIPKKEKTCCYCGKDNGQEGGYKTDGDGDVVCLDCWAKHYEEDGDENDCKTTKSNGHAV